MTVSDSRRGRYKRATLPRSAARARPGCGVGARSFRRPVRVAYRAPAGLQEDGQAGPADPGRWAWSPQGGMGRPVGAQGVHLWHPRCPAEDMGNDQPEGRGWPATALSPAVAGRVRGHFVAAPSPAHQTQKTSGNELNDLLQSQDLTRNVASKRTGSSAPKRTVARRINEHPRTRHPAVTGSTTPALGAPPLLNQEGS